jgi:hypothetical protein
MSEIEREISDSAVSANGQLATTSATPNSQKPPSHLHNANRSSTAGELVFDRTVYTGIGFGVNEIGSLLFTGLFERGKGKYLGKQGFEKGGEWLAKVLKLSDKVAKNSEIITKEHSGKNILMWASLNFIGTVILLPMKLLEDHKAGIVKKLNHGIDRLRGRHLSTEELTARDDEVERAIACEHKQSWPTILIGRAAAMLSAIGGLGYLMGAERNEEIKKISDTAFTKGAQKIDAMAGGNTKVGKLAATDKDHWFHYYARLIGPETLGCLVTSVVLEVVSKFFARKKPQLKNQTLCEGSAAPPPNNATTDEEKPGKSFVRGVAQKPEMSHVQKVASEQRQPLQTGL